MTTKEQWIFVGPPGAGKTYLGKKIGSHFSLPFFDLDALITKECGQTPVSLITSGQEMVFRHLESSLLRKWISSEAGILATGGGTILFPESYGLLTRFHVVLWIKSSQETRLNRLKTSSRPLLYKQTWEEEIKYIDQIRTAFYEDVSEDSLDAESEDSEIFSIFEALRARFF